MLRQPRPSGFTLLEMLVAMTLMTMLAAALYGSTSIAFRGRRTAERGLEPARRSSAAMRMLQVDLESAIGASGILAGPFTGSDDVGREGDPADVLTFHALSRDQSLGDPPSAIVRVEILLVEDDEDPDGMMLVRQTTTNLLAPEEPAALQETLCRRVRSFDASYFDGTSWYESWDSTAQGDVLPMAVEVTLVLDVSTAGDEDYEPAEDDYALTHAFAVPCGRLPDVGTGGAGLSGGTGGMGGEGRGGGR